MRFMLLSAIACVLLGCAARQNRAYTSNSATVDTSTTPPSALAGAEPVDSRMRWFVTGHVRDSAGGPLAGVEITAHCGAGTLRRTGLAATNQQGEYTLEFGPGVWFMGDSSNLQAATIAPHKLGLFERNLHRQGDLLMAARPPDESELRAWGAAPATGTAASAADEAAPSVGDAPSGASDVPAGTGDLSSKDAHAGDSKRAGGGDRDDGRPVVLPNKPVRIDFVMIPAGAIRGRVVDASGAAIVGHYVSLNADELPPSSSALASMKTDAAGSFRFSEVPSGPVWLSIRDVHDVMNELCGDRLEVRPGQNTEVELTYFPGPPARVMMRRVSP